MDDDKDFEGFVEFLMRIDPERTLRTRVSWRNARSDTMKCKGVFCPKCGSRDLESMCADSPEWVADDVICTEEYYICRSCSHDFTIRAGYFLGDFHFLGDDDDDEDYIIDVSE